MRVKQIAVTGLFGVFDHTIPMNLDDRITIILGPNGFGKTALLRILDALFCLRYHQLRITPFAKLQVDFDDNSSISVSKEKIDGSGTSLVFDRIVGGHDEEHFVLKPLERTEIEIPIRMLEREIPGLQQLDPETWLYLPTREELSLEDVIARFSDILPLRTRPSRNEPEWLVKIKELIHIRFIETQRLLNFSFSRRHREYEGRSQMVPSVVTYSEELSNAIQGKLAEYAALSQSLDRTFPSRLVKGGPLLQLTIQDLQDLQGKLNALEEKRSRLIEAGLLDKGEEMDFIDLRTITEINRNVLSVYVEDVEKKLSILDEMSDKLDLLKKIINRRFLYKQMSISKKEGFVFTNSLRQNLAPTNLSSGEQHELVLLYELLFKVRPHSFILIDEPELSLHVVWQQQFLKDLKEITTLANLDVLIATHSPTIIHDRSDLTVELKGPVE